MKTKQMRIKTDIRLTIIIVPVVIALTAGFYYLTANAMLNLSKDRMTYKSENFAKYMSTWTGRILSELDIYKATVDAEGAMNEHTFNVLYSSYGPHAEYPYGLYWGDEYANFYDASGWDPGPEYIPASRNWYIEGLEHERFTFGEPYIDVRADRPCVSATAALNYGGTKSVLAADIYFDYADELVDRLAAQNFDNVFFVSHKSRMIIADSDPQKTGLTLDGQIGFEPYRSISALLDGGFTGLTKVECGEAYYVNISKIDGADWYFVTCMKESTMMNSIHRIDLFILLTGVLGGMTLIFLANRASKEFKIADKEAKTDSLTGLFNRNGFIGAVTAAIKASPAQGALLMLDVDNFKAVNDSLGHPIGDEFLKSFAQMLSGYFNRNGDVCARLGGDEFAVFVGRNVDRDDISAMLGTFISLFHKNYDEKYPRQNLSVSIGAAFTGINGSTFDDIYNSADKALYEAKNSGKNKYTVAENTAPQK